MRFTCFCLKRREYPLDFVYNLLQVKFLAPEGYNCSLRIKMPELIDLIGDYSDHVWRPDIIIDMNMAW